MSEYTALISQGYAALNARDMDGFLDLVADDVELHELPELPGTGVYRGREELKSWGEAAMETWGEWEWTPEEFLYDEGAVVVLRTRMTAVGGGGGVPIELKLFHVVEFRAGKLASMSGFLEQAPALTAALQLQRLAPEGQIGRSCG